MTESLELWLRVTAGLVALVIETIAIVIVAIGSAEAAVGVFRVLLKHSADAEKREVWMRYARWLVAGLTFQLAADIVTTTVAPTWEQIGRLAAIAVIRTFLTFFLDRDMDTVRGRQAKEM